MGGSIDRTDEMGLCRTTLRPRPRFPGRYGVFATLKRQSAEPSVIQAAPFLAPSLQGSQTEHNAQWELRSGCRAASNPPLDTAAPCRDECRMRSEKIKGREPKICGMNVGNCNWRCQGELMMGHRWDTDRRVPCSDAWAASVRWVYGIADADGGAG
jgi:hypothetical protein